MTWLGVTAFAFELARGAAARPAGRYGRVAAGVVVAWVLILGVVVGLGKLVTGDGNGNVLGDLDHHLPTSAYPSGHEAAACCLYVAVAILVIGHARGWWRWLFGIPAVAMPAFVAISRTYRGESHPTDVLGSLLFSALWLTATTLLIDPNADGRVSDRPERGQSWPSSHPPA